MSLLSVGTAQLLPHKAHGAQPISGSEIGWPLSPLSLPHLPSVVLLAQAEILLAPHPFLFPSVPLPLPAVYIVRHGMRHFNLAALRRAIVPITVLSLFLP